MLYLHGGICSEEQEMEYTVVLTQRHELTPLWSATVPALPGCTVEAPSRLEALEKIRRRITEVASRTELVRVDVPAVPVTDGDQRTGPVSTPWEWYGAFKGDATWDQLFDEIERQRDAHLMGE